MQFCNSERRAANAQQDSPARELPGLMANLQIRWNFKRIDSFCLFAEICCNFEFGAVRILAQGHRRLLSAASDARVPRN